MKGRVLTCDPLIWLITALFAVLKDKKNLNQYQINKLLLQAGRTARIFRKKKSNKDLSKGPKCFQKKTEKVMF